MSEGGSVINLGDFTKPAALLIEKISDAVGGYFKPHQIKRLAKAEAEANIIKAQNALDVQEIHQRAIARFISEEAQKQVNMESITEKALPLLNDSAEPNRVDDDWLTNFFDKCRIIKDEEMQTLWAKVLAGEANSPGSYSRRTVNLLNSLDTTDATLFTSLCGYSCSFGFYVPMIFDPQNPIYIKNGLNFASLTHLDNIGLASFNNIQKHCLLNLGKYILAEYHGSRFALEFQAESGNNLEIGHVILTSAGRELAKICGAQPVEGFKDYMFGKFRELGVTVTSLVPAP